MIHRIILPVLLLTGMTLSAVPIQKRLPQDASFSDENTGVVFPPQIRSFRKIETRVSANPVLGTRIQYVGNRIGCSANIYIYALAEKPEVITEKELRDHYSQARQAILNLKSMAKRVEETESARQQQSLDPRNGVILRELFHIRTDGEETYHSELLLFSCGDRIVKLRITVPAAQKEAIKEADQFILEFCKLFFRNPPAAFVSIPSGRRETQQKIKTEK